MKNEKAEKLFELIGDIDEKIIAEAETVKTKPVNVVSFQPKKHLKGIGILVASIAFIVVAVGGIAQIFNLGSDDLASSEIADSPINDQTVAEANRNPDQANEMDVDDEDEFDMGEEQLEYPPAMNVVYTRDGNVNELTILPGILTWSVQNEDGRGYDIDVDRVHILKYDLQSIPTITAHNDLTELSFYFDVSPERVIVRRWSVQHLGFSEQHWDDFEIVLVDGMRLDSDFEVGWIYQVIAYWSQGSADFVFHISD